MSDQQNQGGFPDEVQKTMLDEALYSRPAPARPHERTELLEDEAPPSDMAWLVFVDNGPRHGQMVRLVGRSITIGRADDCELQLEDRAASRQHAKIRIEGSGDTTRYMLHDLATDNGTFVNGNKSMPVELQNNDLIRIGRTELMFKRI